MAVLLSFALLVMCIVQRSFNSEICNLLVSNREDGSLHGKVCLVCDRFLGPKDSSLVSLATFLKYAPYLKGDDQLPLSVRNSYKFTVPNNREANSILGGALLSPRSQIVYKGKSKRCTPHLMCCKECRGTLNVENLKKHNLPRNSIANGWAIGDPPSCLTRLNEIELALVSQARFRGHLFTYWGGCHRSIKGWHTFYNSNVGHTAAALTAVSNLTDSKNIAVILAGPFTTEQKQRVLGKLQINTEWVLEAFQWLKENNRLYVNEPLPDIAQPIIIDQTEEVESENTDIETKEQITVVFPDGTVTTGGLQDGKQFEEAIAEMRTNAPGVTPYVTSRPSQEALRDYEDDNLMKAFPLQFPFGYGLPQAFVRDKTSLTSTLAHMLYLSRPSFHESCFVLVVHNMYERGRALNGAIWRVMGKHETCNVTEEDLNAAIKRKKKGLPRTNGPGDRFLNSVHAVKKNLGHSNEAAMSARSQFLSLTHHFGCPICLFTVSFDDGLDLRILSFSGRTDAVDWINSMTNMSPQELDEQMGLLGAIRIKYPGLCALNFEFLLELVLDKLVGDNPEKKGIFGIMEAFGLAVEEQGRKTLHGHILVYARQWNETLRNLHSKDSKLRQAAEKQIRELVDKIISTELTPDMFTKASNGSECREDLPCPECQSKTLEYPSPQQLRNLRHRIGARHFGCTFSTCTSCQTVFGGNELAYKRTIAKHAWLLSESEKTALVKRDVLLAQLQDPDIPYDSITVAKINQLYNHHLDCHTKTCFKKGDECRATLPEKHEDQTQILRSEEKYEGFAWTGEPLDLTTITVRPRRRPHDAYTNSYSKHITNSRAPSNSNISITTGARSCIYATCYTFKPTQKEDTDELRRMLSYVGHRFLEERRDSVLFEGISRLMGAAIVATSEHVVAAPMAAYLVRNQSRFRCSHKFKYVPIREIIDLMIGTNDENVNMSITSDEQGCFLTNDSLHYLHRPNKLNDVCLFDFCEQFETIRSDKPHQSKPNDGTYCIDDIEHPGHGRQKCRERSEKVLPQFSHWALPDASSFGGSLWEISYPVNTSVEKYCQAVLVLFHPFRELSDLTIRNSYFLKFRNVYKGYVPCDVRNILTNVQMFYNSMRMPPKDDPLFKTTVKYTPPYSDKSDEKEEEEDDGTFFDGMFNVGTAAPQQTTTHQPQIPPSGYDLTAIRKDGGRGCGFFDLPNTVQLTSESTEPFLKHALPRQEQQASSNNKEHTTRDTPSPHQLMSLIYKNQRRRITNSISRNNPDFVADGTALSIIEWSEKHQISLDKEQRKAFQIATANFILTYYDDAQHIDPSSYRDICAQPAQLRHDFNQERRKLRALTRLRINQPLVMFLDGPGGAGKSHVLTELLSYALQYCTNLNLKFDMRTIVVSARSGVAAVSVGGETTHSVAALNRKIADDDVSWANARLLIIDEVSFMNTAEIELLDEKLRVLMRNHTSLFGGIHVIFAGDFRQLEPVSGKPLYSENHSDKKWLHSINSYVELRGTWRFKDDPEWGRILTRIRNDRYTHHDIDAINECTLAARKKRGEDIPSDVAYCVYANRDRSAINAAMFSKALQTKTSTSCSVPEDFIVIRASDMARKHKSGKCTPLTPPDARFIYEHCSDSRVRSKKTRGKGHFVAPLLKLHKHQPLMLVSNDDVANGHANGTRVILQSTVLKPTATVTFDKIDGNSCRSVEAADVDHLLCHSVDDVNKTFKISARTMTCMVNAPLPACFGAPSSANVQLTVQLRQFPIILNYATTGHKLQGQTKESLVISIWSKTKNWNYVALSRVKTREGLFLVNSLPYTTDFAIPAQLRAMMEILKTKTPPDDYGIDLEEERAFARGQRAHRRP